MAGGFGDGLGLWGIFEMRSGGVLACLIAPDGVFDGAAELDHFWEVLGEPVGGIVVPVIRVSQTSWRAGMWFSITYFERNVHD